MVESDKTGIFYIDPTMVDMIPIGQIKPYKRNAKRHPQEQIEQIINSIKAFGMNDPIGVWGKDNIIVEGHGRYLALREMGESGEVPVIHLDNLTDEQRKAYALAHNKLTMNTDFDSELLGAEMEGLKDFFEMSDFGFEESEVEADVTEEIEIKEENPTDVLPDSRIFAFSISAFGTKGEIFLEAEIDQETAESIIEYTTAGRKKELLEKIRGAIHDL